MRGKSRQNVRGRGSDSRSFGIYHSPTKESILKRKVINRGRERRGDEEEWTYIKWSHFFALRQSVFQAPIRTTDTTFGRMIYGFLQLIAKFFPRYYAVITCDKPAI